MSSARNRDPQSAKGAEDLSPGVQHHPAPEELLDYAVGACDLWLDALLACHLTLCPACRLHLSELEALGGALLDAYRDELEAGVAKPSRVKDPTERLGPVTPHHGMRPAIDRLPQDVIRSVPRPLQAFMRDPQPRFRFLVPGIEHIPLTLTAGGRPVRLLRFRPGFVIDEHGHAGLEWLLILSGKLRDDHTGETFARGDVSRRVETDTHRQIIDRAEPCVAVFAHLGAPIPRTWTGRLLAKIIGL